MAIAYGQITIVDISDLGQLSVYPTSNQPYSVIYDPNASGDNQYNPNWSVNNLKLTPVIYYGNKEVRPTEATVSWYKDSSTTAITSGVSGGILTVSDKTVLSPTGSKLVSYTVKVNYSPEGTGATLHAEGKITFSLIEQPTTVKSINITGSTLFLYNGNKELQSPDTITLKANPQNCSITNWYYYKNGVKTNLTLETGTSLVVAASNTTYFPNSTHSCTFGVQSNETEIYDEITIIKVYDGAAGDSAVVAVLSNESQTISFDKNGTPITNAYADAYTVLTVYDGNDVVTSNCVITPTADSTVTGSWDSSNHKYTVSSITASGKVSFKIEYSDPTTNSKKTLYKTFSLVMTQPGADGADAVSYSMSISALAISKKIADDGTITYSPDKIKLTGYTKVGGGARTEYPCRFTVSVNGGSETNLNNSDNATYEYATNKDFTSLVFKMYAAGGTSTLLDSQTVVQTSDGKKGETGSDGVGGVYTGLGNSSDQLACTNAGTPKASQQFQIPFFALQGTAYVPVKATTTYTKPTGVTISGLDALVSGQGTVTLTVGTNANLSNTTIIPITLTATVKGKDGKDTTVTATHNYSLTKSIQGDAGVSAVTLRAFAQGGGVFVNQQGSDTLKAILTSGVTNIADSNVSYKWAKWNGSSYQTINNETNSTLTVQASSVSSFASYMVTATYPKTGGKDYVAYVSILDKSDPLQFYMFSTVGEKLVNSQGRGVVYGRVYQNGQELDSVEGWVFSATPPSNPATNTVWVDYSGDTLAIKKYSGSSWNVYTPTYECDYAWTLTNTNNATTNSYNTRFLLVNSDIVKEKTNFNLTVNYPKTNN